MKPKREWIRGSRGEHYRVDEIDEMRARRAGGGLFYVAFHVAGLWREEVLMVDGELADLLRARSLALMQSVERDLRQCREELMIAAVNNEKAATEKAEAWKRALRASEEAALKRVKQRASVLQTDGPAIIPARKPLCRSGL